MNQVTPQSSQWTLYNDVLVINNLLLTTTTFSIFVLYYNHFVIDFIRWVPELTVNWSEGIVEFQVPDHVHVDNNN